MIRRLAALLVVVGAGLTAAFLVLGPSGGGAWTDAEQQVLDSLSLDALPPAPDDPSNRYDTDPEAAALGKRVFSDKRFSRDGSVSCSSCHMRKRGFQDGKPLAEGIGRTKRRTMPLEGSSTPSFSRAASNWCSLGFWLGTRKRAGSLGISNTITNVTNVIATASTPAQRMRRTT